MKGKKLAFAVILALIVCLVLIPVSAYAEGEGPTTPGTSDPVPPPTVASEPTVTSTTTTDPDVPQPPTAEEEAAITNVETVTNETDLESAVSNVTENTIVEVAADISVPDASAGGAQPISVAATDDETIIVIDLGENTITAANHENHPHTTDVFSFEKGKITLRNGTINGNIRVQGNASVYLDSTLRLNGFVFVKGSSDATPTDPKLNVNCVIRNSSNSAVATNGGCKGGKITISEKADLESTGGAGMYLPGDADVVVNGGRIKGINGIVMKSGSLTLNGGTIIGNGAKADYVYSKNGFNETGDAIIVEYVNQNTSKPYYSVRNFTVNNATTVISENANALNVVQIDGATQSKGDKSSIVGGIYSDKSALDYVADGNVVVKVGEQYGVNEGAFELGDIAAENGEVIEILAAPDGMEIDGVIPGVKFVNKSGNDVFVNGVKIAAGETYTVPGAEFTYTEAYTAKYFVVDGEEQEWTKGSADGLTFKLNSEDVIKVLIDGVEVEFTVENGEIVISAEVLEALEAGEHEIEFVFADGSCKTVFTVK